MEFDQLKQQAKESIANCEWLEAYEILLRMREISPNNFQLLLKLGNVYEALENSTAAKFYYNEATKLKPNNDQAYFELAKLFTKQKEYDLAVQHYQKCLSIDNDKAVTHSAYATLLNKFGDYDMALFHHRKAAEIKPLIANYHYFIAKTALKFRSINRNALASKHFIIAIKLSNYQKIEFINEYVLNWDRWDDNWDFFSIEQTLNYLYLYAINGTQNIKSEYISLCLYVLNANLLYFKFADKLKCINRAIHFEPFNERLHYEKYKQIDFEKYGKYNNKGYGHIIKSKIVIQHNNNNNACESTTTTLYVSDIISNRCKLIVDAYLSHFNLELDVWQIIPYEIQCLCLNYLMDQKYAATLNRMDKFAQKHKLYLTDHAQNECIDMLFQSVVCPSTHCKIGFLIIKLLDFISELVSDNEFGISGCIYSLSDHSEYIIGYRHLFSFIKCECKTNRLLCAYYILYLLSIIGITNVYHELMKLRQQHLTTKYVQQLIILPFKFIQLCHKPQYENIKISFEYLTNLIMDNDKFYTIYYDLIRRRVFSKHKIINKLCMIQAKSDMCVGLNTMRFIAAPLLFGPIASPSHKPLIIPIVNIQLLEDLITNNLNLSNFRWQHRRDHKKYQIALNWFQLELNEFEMDNNNNNNNINVDDILYEMWMYLMRKHDINEMDCNVLRTFINKNICLKPCDMEWSDFYDIMKSPFIQTNHKLVQIIMYYCFCQISKDKNNADDWQHCIDLLNSEWDYNLL